jgi:hypothetical protein
VLLTLFCKALDIYCLTKLLKDDAGFCLHITLTKTVKKIALFLNLTERNERILVHVHLHIKAEERHRIF